MFIRDKVINIVWISTLLHPASARQSLDEQVDICVHM